MLSFVDMIKKKWDVDRLGIQASEDKVFNCASYLQQLTDSYLVKGNIKDVADDCQSLFEVYKDRLLKLDSIEAFLEHLCLKEDVVAEFGSVQ